MTNKLTVEIGKRALIIPEQVNKEESEKNVNRR